MLVLARVRLLADFTPVPTSIVIIIVIIDLTQTWDNLICWKEKKYFSSFTASKVNKLEIKLSSWRACRGKNKAAKERQTFCVIFIIWSLYLLFFSLTFYAACSAYNNKNSRFLSVSTSVHPQVLLEWFTLNVEIQCKWSLHFMVAGRVVSGKRKKPEQDLNPDLRVLWWPFFLTTATVWTSFALKFFQSAVQAHRFILFVFITLHYILHV